MWQLPISNKRARSGCLFIKYLSLSILIVFLVFNKNFVAICKYVPTSYILTFLIANSFWFFFICPIYLRAFICIIVICLWVGTIVIAVTRLWVITVRTNFSGAPKIVLPTTRCTHISFCALIMGYPWSSWQIRVFSIFINEGKNAWQIIFSPTLAEIGWKKKKTCSVFKM